MIYDKPHLPYDQQVRLLQDRGMVIPDHARAITELKRTGYYRLSAYWYPYRRLRPPEPASGTTGMRDDTFIDGTTFSQVIAVYTFDEKLRSTLLEGLEIFEIALRSRIAYHLGKLDPFAYLDSALLKTSEADRIRGGAHTQHEEWLVRFRERCEESRSEDYVRHFQTKYDGKLPIWVATEVMNFGMSTRLLSFVPDKIQTKIAREFGIQRPGDLLSWSRTLNGVRNHCAHHGRIWNRRLTVAPALVHANRVDERIAHLAHVDRADANKIYYSAALLACAIRNAAPHSNWPRTFRTIALKFLNEDSGSASSVMGFPDSWEHLDLWTEEKQK